MSIPEAVGLVLQAATLGEPGAIYLLEMGEQIKLVDLARNLIRLSGHLPEEVPIEFVGLRPGEKLREELVGDGEETIRSSIDEILRVRSEISFDSSFLLKIQEMAEARNFNNHRLIIKQLQELIPTFISTELVEENGSSNGRSSQIKVEPSLTKRILTY